MTDLSNAVRAHTGLNGNNPQVARLPNHLRQFAVNQRYDDYTPIDHAVWRYIMRQNVYFLKKYAHKVYFQGLLDTGISINRIPSIHEMNDILGGIGWGAVAVDGFIPPAAFMEFQAFKVLVIACDMRQINHIEYTPAPDIVHEAAGHAPIIVDRPYAEYLRRFGEVGSKAMSSKRDFELYEAIRHLSILKECPTTEPDKITAAEEKVEYLQNNLGKPSEMALLSRLHWWTVEYGLIGSLEAPKIYGAGLLSSIGESISCLEPAVKKIPYSIDAQTYAFDITTKQPQLFVTPSFEHLTNVLEEFVAGMAFTVGGMSGLNKAIECGRVSTVEYSSGLQVTGVVAEALADNKQPSFLKFTGPSALAVDYRQLEGHSKEYHQDGFSSPVGRLLGDNWPLESFNDDQLKARGIEIGQTARLSFEGGIQVTGTVERITRHNGRTVVISFNDCTVRQGDTILFQPEWGMYDMAVGETIVSVFHGPADKDAYNDISIVPRERTIKIEQTDQTRALNRLYQKIRDVRNGEGELNTLLGIWKVLETEHPNDWLAPLEIVELLVIRGVNPELATEIRAHLEKLAEENTELAHLITQGHFLTDYFSGDGAKLLAGRE